MVGVRVRVRVRIRVRVRVRARARARARVRVSRLYKRAGYVQGYIFMAVRTVHMVVVRLG